MIERAIPYHTWTRYAYPDQILPAELRHYLETIRLDFPTLPWNVYCRYIMDYVPIQNEMAAVRSELENLTPQPGVFLQVFLQDWTTLATSLDGYYPAFMLNELLKKVLLYFPSLRLHSSIADNYDQHIRTINSSQYWSEQALAEPRPIFDRTTEQARVKPIAVTESPPPVPVNYTRTAPTSSNRRSSNRYANTNGRSQPRSSMHIGSHGPGRFFRPFRVLPSGLYSLRTQENNKTFQCMLTLEGHATITPVLSNAPIQQQRRWCAQTRYIDFFLSDPADQDSAAEVFPIEVLAYDDHHFIFNLRDTEETPGSFDTFNFSGQDSDDDQLPMGNTVDAIYPINVVQVAGPARLPVTCAKHIGQVGVW